jgi:hypothetical protein
MQDDLTKFLSAVRKQDYRVDFKLDSEGRVEVVVPEPAPVVIPEPEVVVPEPEVVVPPAI